MYKYNIDTSTNHYKLMHYMICISLKTYNIHRSNDSIPPTAFLQLTVIPLLNYLGEKRSCDVTIASEDAHDLHHLGFALVWWEISKIFPKRVVSFMVMNSMVESVNKNSQHLSNCWNRNSMFISWHQGFSICFFSACFLLSSTQKNPRPYSTKPTKTTNSTPMPNNNHHHTTNQLYNKHGGYGTCIL